MRILLVGTLLLIALRLLAQISTEFTRVRAQAWIDVMQPAYGAKCDGATDDTSAFAAAITALGGKSGTVFIPPGRTCVIASSGATAINMDQLIDAALNCGPPNFAVPSGNVGCILKFTGTPSIAFSARSSFGVSVNGIQFEMFNASFMGNVIDTSHVIAADTQNFTLSNSVISAAGTDCAIGVNFDQTIVSSIEDNIFFGCGIQVRGIAGPGSYSNANRIVHNQFQGGAEVSKFIVSPGQAAQIDHNTFEDNNYGVPVLADSGPESPSGSTVFSGNWIGDGSTSRTYDILQTFGSGLVVEGNFVWLAAPNATFLNIANERTPANIFVHGNNICGGATLGRFASLRANPSVEISHGNCMERIATFVTGAPASGRITDPTGTTTLYGKIVFADQTSRGNARLLPKPAQGSATSKTFLRSIPGAKMD